MSYKLNQVDNVHLAYQLQEWGGPTVEMTKDWFKTELSRALTLQTIDIINRKGNHIGTLQANLVANDAIAKTVAANLHDRLVYQIVPAAIVATIATALFNVATIYSYFNPAPAVVGTNENCTDALKQCKDAIPVLQARRNEAKTDWKACLNTLQDCKNSLNGTLDNYNDLMSNYTNLMNSCNSTKNNTVN